MIAELPLEIRLLLDNPVLLAQKLSRSPELAKQVFALIRKERGANLLREGDLIERRQFDGDIPEFRTTPLPPGVHPAVPVRTNSLNPVAVGAQLRKASQDMLEAIRAYQEENPGEREHPNYRAGSFPAAQDVGEPSMPETLSERQEAAFVAMSTTQGRRSATDLLWEAVATQLPFVVVRGEAPKVVASSSWTVSVDNFRNWNPEFSIYDVAGRAIAAKLQKQLVSEELPYRLQVYTVDSYDTRQVGWSGVLSVI
jgi:hypothetical protein